MSFILKRQIIRLSLQGVIRDNYENKRTNGRNRRRKGNKIIGG